MQVQVNPAHQAGAHSTLRGKHQVDDVGHVADDFRSGTLRVNPSTYGRADLGQVLEPGAEPE
jgi:hypothetical protein